MKTMSYEVELLKAWMDQGHRTEYDGTPIPPVMPEPTPTGEPTESWDAWARREAPGDDSEECNETTLRVRFEMALRNLGHLRKESDDRRLPAVDPLPEGARASVSDDAVFSPDEHSVHFEVSMVVDGDPAEFASRAHAWLAAVLSRAKDGA